MILTVNKKQSVEIENAVVAQIFNMYSEEKLIGRPIFQNAFANDSIEYKDLKDESDKILIPWQMFLFDSRNLKKELDHIEKMRADKVSSKLMAKRRGIGNVTSKRIIDRLIRLQNFITATNTLPQNAFCGSLVGKSNAEAVAHILSYFVIEKNFRAKALSATNKQKKIYSVPSEVLLPSEATEKLSGSVITPSTRDDLASEYKITPTAVVVTLRIRRTITSQAEYEALLPPPYDPPKTPTHHPRSPKIETSVRKFCGKYSFEFVNAGIKSGQLSSVQSQYLLFGAVNKKNFKKYRDGLSI